MKKLVLTIAAGTCAMSAYAADPEPINFNVQLSGEVPSQEYFEIKPDVSLEQALSIPVPDDWDGSEQPVHQLVSFSVKSSYGPVRVTYRHNQETSGNAYQVHLVHKDDPDSYIRIRPYAKIGSRPGGNDMLPGRAATFTIASADAAVGTTFNYAAKLFTGGSGKMLDGTLKPGVYTGNFTFVFDADPETT